MLLRTVLAALLSVALAGFPGTVNRAGHETVRHEHAGDAGRRLDGASPSPPSPDYTCSPGHEGSTDWKVTGTNLGGWLVLEPWITPSLFYQFLSSDETWGKNAPDHTGMDTYSFCAALGPHEANKQLRRHWAAWVRDEDIESIAKSNASHVRIPVGDWMWESYGPYANCTEGALHELDRALDLCKKYKLKVLIDIHTAKGSQNGFDNSGQARLVRWTSLTTQADPNGVTTFEHWPVRAADWIGPYDTDTASYPKIETANIEHQLRVVEKIASQYKDHPAVWGIEPLNEPWQMIPLSTLKSFYWDAYRAVRKKAPRWIFVFHDSFRGYSAAWADFLTNCPNKAMDTHIYQAWNRPGALKTYHNNACNFRKNIREIEDTLDMPLIVGEWSLATDNCAMWLNGFNDNLPGYPKVSCTLWPCAAPYMGYDQPGCPPAKDQPLQGPYGTGVSGPQFGMCPVTVEWGDQVDTFMTALAMKYLNAFNSGHGWFFWNFRTELDPQWSYNSAYYKGWFPGDVSDFTAGEVTSACPAGGPSVAGKASGTGGTTTTQLVADVIKEGGAEGGASSWAVFTRALTVAAVAAVLAAALLATGQLGRVGHVVGMLGARLRSGAPSWAAGRLGVRTAECEEIDAAYVAYY